MAIIDSETFITWRKAADLVRMHDSQIRAALEQRRADFVKAATDARRSHLAGALTEPARPGHILLIDNAGLQSAALMFKAQAEACVGALLALNAATGDEYDYEIFWEVKW